MELESIDVTDGSVTPESWVYVWRRSGTGEVLYVGATGLPLAARTWLHLHHEDPQIGRVRAERPDALDGEVIVSGFAIDPALDRQAVKSAVQCLLDDADPEADEGVVSTALEIVEDLRD